MIKFRDKLKDIHSISILFSNYFILFKNYIIKDIKGMLTLFLKEGLIPFFMTNLKYFITGGSRK